MDELLASVMRKVIASRNDMFGCYIDIRDNYIVIDGTVEELTPEEVQALREVLAKTS